MNYIYFAKSDLDLISKFYYDESNLSNELRDLYFEFFKKYEELCNLKNSLELEILYQELVSLKEQFFNKFHAQLKSNFE